ncbi:hypothetical protein ND861_18735 [Leptospira sp. 2 VSF19]|uniref:Immunity protein 63 domain-containing protein n=1 Tax=Leptospira soteropolitanensis TaxID=2950025 RepID=A0AAW5VRM7_9LEPT|nr:hypothetical protein [Leptospira soteropolitanensis]MCW7494696.1 hypothetical protein [Leptospira soteropolitanensis]MCW7502303.1 hypothetical protein [Leptospira soteropolitanensis]MCW7524525.1 hypothetical protein [Leptospira soteropolitanensis]MCW7528401.1 hypothetical protein [Leptospira soteropolitanensis]MCW7532253.1 hypothetical protein [Leptospira soteropolitanensis]
MNFYDSFEINLINYIESYKSELEKSKFKFYSKTVGPGMGAIVELSNKDHNLIIINDRGQFFLDLKSKSELKNLNFQLNSILSYILFQNMENLDKVNRKQVLLGEEFPDLLTDPLKYYFIYRNEIKDIELNTQYKKIINKLQTERSKYLFSQ